MTRQLFLREINKQTDDPQIFTCLFLNYKDMSFSIAGSIMRYNKLSDWWSVIVQIFLLVSSCRGLCRLQQG